MEIDYKQNALKQQPDDIRAMFNAIAPTYDRLNHLLSFGMDIRWRRKAIQLLGNQNGSAILDIAAGSGDLSLDLLRLNPSLVVSSDFAINMLQVLRQKLSPLNGASRIRPLGCDAMWLPFRDRSFDATVVAFGIRNVADRRAALKEMLRVLRPGGMTMILELAKPRTPIVGQMYTLYAKAVLPIVGSLLSRNASAYRYLPESIAQFPSDADFLEMMREAGFTGVFSHRLTFGVAMIYVGTKPL